MANYEMDGQYVKWTPELMVEVELETPDSFLLAKETLTRIGVASRYKKNCIKLPMSFTKEESITLFIISLGFVLILVMQQLHQMI